MKNSFLPIVLIVLLLSSCQSFSILISGQKGRSPSPSPSPKHEPEGPRNYRSYSVLKIPPGHLPPPGRCRVWIPNRPPGQQGPPTSCSQALRDAPPGSWIITRMDNNHDHLEVREVHQSRRGVIIETEIYLIN